MNINDFQIRLKNYVISIKRKRKFQIQMAFLFCLFVFLAWNNVFSLMDVIVLAFGIVFISFLFLGGYKYFLK